jgi:hypothetical protein
VQPGDRQCPHCHKPLDVASAFRRLWERLGFAFNRTTAVRCPKCNKTGSLKFGYCTGCGCNFTVASATEKLLLGPRKIWDRNVTNATATTRRRFKWYYLLFSVVIFFTTLTAYTKFLPANWLGTALLTLLFLMLFLVLLFGLTPRQNLVAFARKTPPVIKLSLVFNYFTVLLLLQFAVSIWHAQAVIMAILCLMSWLGFYVFLVHVWPVWVAMGSFFQEPVYQFDPRDNQGRRAYRDQGGRR